MKVETNLKSGNILTSTADMGCQSLYGIAGFINRANREATSLANGVANQAQTAWNTVAGWVKSI